MRPTRSGQPHLGQPHVLYMCVPGTGAQDVLQQPGAAAVREQHSVVALTAIRPAIASSARVGCSTVGCSTKFCSSAGPPQSVATAYSVRHSTGQLRSHFPKCETWHAQLQHEASAGVRLPGWHSALRRKSDGSVYSCSDGACAAAGSNVPLAQCFTQVSGVVRQALNCSCCC